MKAINPKSVFCYCLYKSAMNMKSMLDEALSEFGLVTMQFGILSHLHRCGPLSQIEIGNQMSMDKTSVVKFIDGLEKLKLVQRVSSKADRRIKSITITPKGVKLFGKGVVVRKKVEKAFLKPLTAREKKVLAVALPKLLK